MKVLKSNRLKYFVKICPTALSTTVIFLSFLLPQTGVAFSINPSEWFQSLFSDTAPGPQNTSTKFVFVTSREALIRLSLKNSVYVNWEVFTQPGSLSRGQIRSDLSRIAEDLALYGIHPNDSIVIVGRGLKGRGEEGRLQWLLKYWGFRDVKIASYESPLVTKAEKTENVSPPQKVKIPKLKVRTDLAVSTDDVLKNPTNYIYLDTRHIHIQTYPKFFTDNNLNVIRRAWGAFYNSDLSVSQDAEAYVIEAGLREAQKPIVVLSHAGLSSAGVALVLRDLGVNALLLPEGFFGIQPDFDLKLSTIPNSSSDL